jgi:hypothetical protein
VPYLQGSHSVTVTISDVGGATVSTADVVVIGPGPDNPTASGTHISATEGQSFSGVIGSFQDLDEPSRAGTANSVQIDWGDGTTSVGSVTLISAGNFSVNGNHVYQEEGSYTLAFTITPVGSSSRVQATSSVQVADAPLKMVAVTPPGVVLVGQAINNYPVATFTDADIYRSLGDYTAQISWGDGAVTAGVLRDNGDGTFSVLGSHVYGLAGPMTIGVTVHDAGGASVSSSAVIPAQGGGTASPLFLGDAQIPAADPPSPFASELAMFQAFEAWFLQELQLFFALSPSQMSLFGL